MLLSVRLTVLSHLDTLDAADVDLAQLLFDGSNFQKYCMVRNQLKIWAIFIEILYHQML